MRRYSMWLFMLGISITLPLLLATTNKPTHAAGAPQCEIWVTQLGSGTISVLDSWTSNRSSVAVTQSAVNDIAFNRSGTKVFATTSSTGLHIIDSATRISSNVQGMTTGDYATVAANPVSDLMIVGTDNFPIPNPNDYKILNSETGAAVATINSTTRANAIVVAPDGTAFATLFEFMANPSHGEVQKINIAQSAIASSTQLNLAANEYLTDAAIATPAGNSSTLFVTSSDGTVYVINPSNFSLITSISVGGMPTSVASSVDGSKVFVASFLTNTIHVINTVTRQVISTIPLSSQPSQLAVSPDGSHLYATGFVANVVFKINLSTLVVEALPNFTMPSEIMVGPPGCTTTAPPVTPAANPSVPTTTVAPTPQEISITPSSTSSTTAVSIATTQSVTAGQRSSAQLPNTGSNVTALISMGFLLSLCGLGLSRHHKSFRHRKL